MARVIFTEEDRIRAESSGHPWTPDSVWLNSMRCSLLRRSGEFSSVSDELLEHCYRQLINTYLVTRSIINVEERIVELHEEETRNPPTFEPGDEEDEA